MGPKPDQSTHKSCSEAKCVRENISVCHVDVSLGVSLRVIQCKKQILVENACIEKISMEWLPKPMDLWKTGGPSLGNAYIQARLGHS